MDYYAKYQEELTSFRKKLVNAIKIILTEKGYSVGDTVNEFIWESDRLLIKKYDGPYHPDNLSTEFLLESVRKAMHIIPKHDCN